MSHSHLLPALLAHFSFIDSMHSCGNVITSRLNKWLYFCRLNNNRNQALNKKNNLKLILWH